MRDSHSLLLPILEMLADGNPQRAQDVERRLIETGTPLGVSCGTGKALLEMADERLLHEESDWNVFTITKSGLQRLKSEREEALKPKAAPVAKVPQRQQKSMF